MLSMRGISKTFDDQAVLDAIDLDVAHGEFVTLLGPSGCGKTTLLRVIAGLETPTRGTILLDDADLLSIPAEQRQVNTVFQSYALFPHMTVFANVAFGLSIKGIKGEALRSRVMEALDMVKMSDFAGRFPKQLSGGQQQRVAMARAIVNRPRVLLLDEPLSALDARLRQEMQGELKRLQRKLGITFIFVTHDQGEALSMSDRVVVMQEGKIAQVGTPRQVYEDPGNLYVARFVGEINLFPGKILRRVDDTHLMAEVFGRTVLVSCRKPFEPGQKVQLLLRPEDLRLPPVPPEGQAAFEGSVVERSYRGSMLNTTIQLDAGPSVTACEFFDEDDPDFDYRIGERVVVSWVKGWEVVLPDEA